MLPNQEETGSPDHDPPSTGRAVRVTKVSRTVFAQIFSQGIDFPQHPLQLKDLDAP
jgi:hypothetical protein